MELKKSLIYLYRNQIYKQNDYSRKGSMWIKLKYAAFGDLRGWAISLLEIFF